MKRHLKAFTLIEVVVVMALTGIIISIAGISYSIIGRQMSLFNEKTQKMYALHRAVSLLTDDYQKHGIVYYEANQLRMVFDNGQEVDYRFQDDTITRESNNITEKIGVSATVSDVEYNGHPGTYLEVIDEINMVIRYKDESYPLYLAREYNASEQLQIQSL